MTWQRVAVLAIGGALAVGGAAFHHDNMTSAGLAIVGAWVTLWLKGRGGGSGGSSSISRSTTETNEAPPDTPDRSDRGSVP